MPKNKKNKVEKYIDSLHELTGKTVIVTGANSGLGYQITKIALLKGAFVVMACRNHNRAESAKERLIQETGSKNIAVELYDQSDVKSIHAFSSIIKEKYKGFYALILNAGLFMPEEVTDEFYISTVYKTNFIGVSILLSDLKGFIDESTRERKIIFQGSLSTFFYKYKNKDKFIYGEDGPFKQYSLSKLCITYLFAHYRDNNRNHHVKYLLCEPGIASTNIIKNFPKWVRVLAIPYIALTGNSAEIGSLSACKLLCDLTANGDYYKPKHLFSSKGFPKKRILPDKVLFKNIIEDSEEIIKIYESR